MSMSSTASAIEDLVLDLAKSAEELMLRTAHSIAEELEPITKGLRESRGTTFLPPAEEFLDHTFRFVDRTVADLREFASQLLVPRSETGETAEAAEAAPTADTTESEDPAD
jgi:hypothetical protein